MRYKHETIQNLHVFLQYRNLYVDVVEGPRFQQFLDILIRNHMYTIVETIASMRRCI